MKRAIWAISAGTLALAGCAGGTTGPGPEPQPTASGAPLSAMRPPPPEARSAEEFDTTTPAERTAAAAPPPVAEDQLGRTVASLGDPADPGFWALTPLVSAPRQGRLADPATGFSVMVELRPRTADQGSGTLVSLPAMRALGVPLTGLPELVVYAAAP